MNELERKIEQLEKYIEVREQECNELQEKIDRATRYIEKCKDYHKTIHNDGYLYPDEITSLIMILKGE